MLQVDYEKIRFVYKNHAVSVSLQNEQMVWNKKLQPDDCYLLSYSSLPVKM